MTWENLPYWQQNKEHKAPGRALSWQIQNQEKERSVISSHPKYTILVETNNIGAVCAAAQMVTRHLQLEAVSDLRSLFANR